MAEPIVIAGQRVWLKQYRRDSRAVSLEHSTSSPAAGAWTPCAHRHTVAAMPRAIWKRAGSANCRRKR